MIPELFCKVPARNSPSRKVGWQSAGVKRGTCAQATKLSELHCNLADLSRGRVRYFAQAWVLSVLGPGAQLGSWRGP